jgi:hypothetical protein
MKIRKLFVLVISIVIGYPPVTRRVRSEHAPWLTSEIKKKIYDRDFLKKTSIKTGSTHFFNAYKNYKSYK